MRLLLIITVIGLFYQGPSFAQKAADGIQYEWNDIGRIVAIGDVHGDFDQFVTVLKDAGLVNDKLRWRGGDTHLVQLGDIPDRGPDSRKAMDLMMRLEKQARKAGGRVHALIGNHEALNMAGDLRYAHPGEYKAFQDRQSKKRQDNYYQRYVTFLKDTTPKEELPVFDKAYRAEWNMKFPLGYVEHRLAWSPDGTYGKWVRQHNVIVKINDILFVHGGLNSEEEAIDNRLTLAQMNVMAREVLALGEKAPLQSPILADDGPLWDRSLANGSETQEAQKRVEAMLTSYGARRIIIAHTPLAGAILPRYNGRVVIADVGLSTYYGARHGFVIIEKDNVTINHRGQSFALPENEEARQDYFDKIMALDPDPSPVRAYLNRVRPEPEKDIEAEGTDRGRKR